MNSHDENLTKLCGVLQRNTKADVVVGPETQLASDLEIDSAQLMEVLLGVEDEFDVSIPLNVLPNVYSVEDLTFEIDKLLGASG